MIIPSESLKLATYLRFIQDLYDEIHLHYSNLFIFHEFCQRTKPI